MVSNKHLSGLKSTVPASFILSQEIDPELMPPMPSDPNSWDDYFLKVYNARLSAVLEKEKAQFEKEISKEYEGLKSKLLIMTHLEVLNNFLNCPSKHPRRHPFPNCITRLRKMMSQIVSDKLYEDLFHY